MEEELFCLLLVLLGYALGAIPFGIVVSKALNLPDPRAVGSKNVGFTNVLRVSGAKAGVLTLLGDMGKGWLIGWAAMQWLHTESFMMLAALSPIIGHIFSRSWPSKEAKVSRPPWVLFWGCRRRSALSCC